MPGCVVACWWQVGVARSGDSLGWIYSVMWPCFAVFGTVFWWHFVHDDPDTVGRRGLRRLQQSAAGHHSPGDGDGGGGPTDDDPDERRDALARAEAEDPELAAYNAYLASLARDDRRRSRRRR
ncbi:MAG: hypothetical protein ABSC30_07870 [Acidimicrobiales bacterium]